MGLTEEDKREADWFRRVLSERIAARSGEIAIAVGVPVGRPAAQTIARIAVEEMVSALDEVEREEEAKGEGEGQ